MQLEEEALLERVLQTFKQVVAKGYHTFIRPAVRHLPYLTMINETIEENLRVIRSAFASKIRGFLIPNPFINYSIWEHRVSFLGCRAENKATELEIIPTG